MVDAEHCECSCARGAVMSRKVVSEKDIFHVQNLSGQIYSLSIMEKTLDSMQGHKF